MINLAANISFQFAQIPLLVYGLSQQQYSLWLVLSAVPFLLAMGDLGLSAAGSIAALQAYAAGNVARAREIFQSYCAVVLATLTVGAGGLSLLVASGQFSLPGGALSSQSGRLTFVLLTLWALFCSIWTLLEGGCRVVGRFPLGLSLLATARVGDLIALSVAVLLWGELWSAALAMFAWRAGALGVAVGLNWSTIKPVAGGVPTFKGSEVRYLAKPALGSLMLPVSTSISAQGILLFAAATVSANSLIVLNLMRVICSTARQVSLSAAYGVSAEFTRLHAQRRLPQEAVLLRRTITVSLVLASVGAILSVAVAPHVVPLMSAGIEPALVTTLIVAAIICIDGVWAPVYVHALAHNDTFTSGLAMLMSSGLGLGVGVALDIGLNGYLLGLLISSACGLTSIVIVRRRPLASLRKQVGR